MPRTPVGDATQAPWKYVGQWFAGANKWGSGVLIGDRYVLTAGHVFGAPGVPGGISSTDQSYFVPAYADAVVPFGSVQYDPTTSASFSTFVTGQDLSQDIAVVRVQSNSTIPVSELPGLVLFVNNAAVGKFVTTAGYAPELDNGQTMYSASGTITGTKENPGVVTLSSSIDPRPGHSGSPIFYTDDEGRTYVAGVINGKAGLLDAFAPIGTIFTTTSYRTINTYLKQTEGNTNPANLPQSEQDGVAARA